jgi:hypothetical protein
LELLLSATIAVKEYGARDRRNTLHTMENLMEVVKEPGHIREVTAFGFKDATGRTSGVTHPVAYLDQESLSETVIRNIGPKARNGYYIFGMSIMDGYHTAILVAKVREYEDVKFNIFDQFGSFIDKVRTGENPPLPLKSWYDGDDINEALLLYVGDGYIAGYNVDNIPILGATTITLYQLTKKEVSRENK